MASRSKLVAIPCILHPGMFPSERVFAVQMADGTVYNGIAPRYFCWNNQGMIVAEDEDTNAVPGVVAARTVEELDADQVAVEVPNGEVIAVPGNVIRARPTRIEPPSFSPEEPTENVPVRP